MDILVRFLIVTLVGGYLALEFLSSFFCGAESGDKVESEQTRAHRYGACESEGAVFIHYYSRGLRTDVDKSRSEFFLIGCEDKVARGFRLYDIFYICRRYCVELYAFEVLACLTAACNHQEFAAQTVAECAYGLTDGGIVDVEHSRNRFYDVFVADEVVHCVENEPLHMLLCHFAFVGELG